MLKFNYKKINQKGFAHQYIAAIAVVAIMAVAGVRVLTASHAATPELSIPTLHGCPAYWVCFYKNANFGGTREQFSSVGVVQKLANFGFANQVSSWVDNDPSHTVTVWNVNKTVVLWIEGFRGAVSYVGNSANDKANYFEIN